MTTGLLDELAIFFTGKRIAVIGQRESGKTTFHRIVRGLPDEPPDATVGAEPMPRGRNRQVGLPVRRGLDVSGAKPAYDLWAEQVRAASLVFYLFDAARLRQEEPYEERFREDAVTIAGWDLAGKAVYLIGTHADQDAEYARLGLAGYGDLVLELPAVAIFRHRVPVHRAEVGSLVNPSDVAGIVRRLLNRKGPA